MLDTYVLGGEWTHKDLSDGKLHDLYFFVLLVFSPEMHIWESDNPGEQQNNFVAVHTSLGNR